VLYGICDLGRAAGWGLGSFARVFFPGGHLRWKGPSAVNVTFSFALTPRERRQSLRAWSYLGILRGSWVGLPIAAAGVGLVIWRLKPGAASGWAVIVTIIGLGILAFPQIALMRGLIRSNQRGRTVPELVHVTLGDGSLKYGRDGFTMELAWRYVTDIQTTPDCWIISIRDGQTALVVPKRALPAASEPEITEFLRQRRRPVMSGPGSD
jgi:YcxB-like protein